LELFEQIPKLKEILSNFKPLFSSPLCQINPIRDTYQENAAQGSKIHSAVETLSHHCNPVKEELFGVTVVC